MITSSDIDKARDAERDRVLHRYSANRTAYQAFQLAKRLDDHADRLDVDTGWPRPDLKLASDMLGYLGSYIEDNTPNRGRLLAASLERLAATFAK